MTTLDLHPAPGAAPTSRMLAAQAALELRLTLRRGESVLLTLIIPLALLLFFTSVDALPAGSGRPIDFVTPGVLALAVLSTSFTGLAIATGFERSYGALKRLGASALPRSVLLAGKTLAVLAVELLQVILLVAVGYALGWHPHGNPAVALLLIVVGTASFSALGLLMAGTLRAEATLAAANGVYLVLLLLGGIVFPLSQLPGPVSAVAEVLPAAALADGLRSVFSGAAGIPLVDLAVLAGWAIAAGTLAARTFRWE
ncbi:MAG TPA: ABC transporter permease [Frankiaceae bacterium]|nr:ABC transporter permease [Frankiaceae bacterium]